VAAGAVILALGTVGHRQAATWQDSITLFERAREVSPESPAVHLNLASAYLRVARLQEAEKELVETVRLEPRSYMAHYNLGVLFERREDYASAVESFRHARQLNPQNPKVVYSLIRSLNFLGRRNEAHALLNASLKNLPATPENMRQVAALALWLGSVRQAQALLLQAEQLGPPDAESLNLMGFTFMAEDKRGKAEESFRRAIDLFPNDARGYLNLSRLYFQDNRLDEARAVLEEGLGRAWDRDRLRDQLATLKTAHAATTENTP
jgi:Flp pilus assembly protein TadD